MYQPIQSCWISRNALGKILFSPFTLLALTIHYGFEFVSWIDKLTSK